MQVALHIRPLIADERQHGCRECVSVTQGKPQVGYYSNSPNPNHLLLLHLSVIFFFLLLAVFFNEIIYYLCRLALNSLINVNGAFNIFRGGGCLITFRRFFLFFKNKIMAPFIIPFLFTHNANLLKFVLYKENKRKKI